MLQTKEKFHTKKHNPTTCLFIKTFLKHKSTGKLGKREKLMQTLIKGDIIIYKYITNV